MRNLYLLLSIIVLSITSSCEQATAGQRKFKLSGKFTTDKNEGQNIYLQLHDSKSNSYIPTDTTTVTNGVFVFKGTIDGDAQIRYISVEGIPKPVLFVMEEGSIEMSFDTALVSTVSGTVLNDAYQKYVTDRESSAQRIKIIAPQLKQAKADNKFGLEAILNVKLDSIYKESKVQAFNLAKDNINNALGKFIFVDRGKSFDKAQLEEILPLVDAELKNIPKFQEIENRQRALQRTAVGNNFVDLTGKTPEGEDLSLSQFIGKGKYVAIIFWASWCPSCREEIPHIISIYNQYKDKGFEIFGVSLDQENAAWIKGIEELKIAWPQISDLKKWKSDLAAAYAINGIPHMVLLDKTGKIVVRDISTGELPSVLAELLK